MKHFKDKERQEPISNGYAHDVASDLESKVESKVKEMANMASPEVRGYLTLAGGLLLLAHTLGYFPLLNWALMALSVAGIFYGANTSHVWDSIKQVASYLKNMASNKSNR